MNWKMSAPAILAVFGVACSASGDIFFVGLGSAPTPPTIGPGAIPLSRAQADSVNPVGLPCTSMQISPFTTAQFTQATPVHRLALSTWGRGYAGDLYDTAPTTDLTITFTGPNQLDAFVFYATPNGTGQFGMVLGGSEGGTPFLLAFAVRAPLNGGTLGFGFYTTGTSKVASVVISSSVPLTVGEFYYHNPAPSSCVLLGLAGLGVARRRRAVW